MGERLKGKGDLADQKYPRLPMVQRSAGGIFNRQGRSERFGKRECQATLPRRDKKFKGWKEYLGGAKERPILVNVPEPPENNRQ